MELGALAIRRGAPWESLQRLALDLKATTDLRVSFISLDGVVLADSDVPEEELADVENHGQRPEVLGALQGRVAFGERRSATVGVPLLYGARTLDIGGRAVVFRLAAPLVEIDGAVRSVQRAVAGAGLVALLLAIAGAYLLSRVLARPLVLLSNRARQVAGGEFPGGSLPSSPVVELDELARGFNRLTTELQGRLSELARERDEVRGLLEALDEGVVAITADARILRINRAARLLVGAGADVPLAPVGAVVENPELRVLLEESVVSPIGPRELRVGSRHYVVSSRRMERGGSVVTFLDVSEIRRLEEVRRDFVANASHELKTPLTSIRGFAEALLDDEPPEDLRLQFLSAIRKNAVRLQNLVDDLLDLSRLESGGWRARKDEVDLAELAARVWEELEVEEGRLDFTVEGAGAASGDEQGLAQVFRNLFDNAARHTPPGGAVRVLVEPLDEMLEVAVTDTGSGIPLVHLPRIFERFYRADPARSREAGGTGLGLAIVRHLVQSMGGAVRAESRLGQGTTIRFTVPRAVAPGGAKEER